MTQQIIRSTTANQLRPKMALGLDSVDPQHVPHHLRRYDVETARLQIGLTFSPVGKWVEMRVEEYFTKAGSAREQRKDISTTYDGKNLLALCDFFEEVKRQLTAEAIPADWKPNAGPAGASSYPDQEGEA